MTSTIPHVDPALPGLSIAQATRAEPFLLEGDRVRFAGHQTRSGGQVLFRSPAGTADMTAGLRAEGLGHAANLVLYPGVARRDFTGPRGSMVETVVTPRTLPFLAWQLSGAALEETEVRIDIATPTTHPTVEPTSSGVVVRSKDVVLHLALVPDPVALEVTDSDGGILVTARLTGDTPSTVVLASGTKEEVVSAQRAALHLGAHAVAAARAEDDVLRTHTGVDAVDDGLSWALTRARTLIIERPSAALSLGLAATSMGHGEVAARAVASLRASTSTLVDAGLLAARIGSTMGDVGPAADLAERILARADSLESDLLGLSARSLADALQYGASPDTLMSLRTLGSRASSPVATSRPSTGGISLPMAGASTGPDAPTPGRATWLEGLLSGDAGEPCVVEDVRASRARRAASAFRSDPDRAWADWRALMDEGLAQGVAGPGTWDDLYDLQTDRGAGGDRPAATAEVLLAFVHGMLGLSPDAPVGRLRLAPRMPTHLTSFVTAGIPIGDGTIRLTYERAGNTVRYSLEPERIGVPPLLVFEPSVPGSVRSIEVDGEGAELDLRTDAGQTVVPVQLPLDNVRTLGFTID
jgi:hypothetical protein